MRRALTSLPVVVLLSGLAISAQTNSSKSATLKPSDTSPYSTQFVAVQNDVKLEVLDWGGSGRPLILLAGGGETAHVFDKVAPELVSRYHYHVYGITRRGFGASSAPDPDSGDYSADRLGDDVLAVMAALKIERPVLVGHSLAGEELSSIGTRYPEKVAGLIYIDAAYSYAYYDVKAKQADMVLDSDVLRAELKHLIEHAASGMELKAGIDHLQEVTLPRFENDLREQQKLLIDVSGSPPRPISRQVQIIHALDLGMKAYGSVKCPALALFADPHNFGSHLPSDPMKRQAMITQDKEQTTAQVDAYRAGNPLVRVVVYPNADHFLFNSNEEQVLHEMNAFIAKLP